MNDILERNSIRRKLGGKVEPCDYCQEFYKLKRANFVDLELNWCCVFKNSIGKHKFVSAAAINEFKKILKECVEKKFLVIHKFGLTVDDIIELLLTGTAEEYVKINKF